MRRFVTLMTFFLLCSCTPVSIFRNANSDRKINTITDLTAEQKKLQMCSKLDFFEAAKNECDERAISLIKENYNLISERDDQSNTILHLASKGKLKALFEYLLSIENIDLNKRGADQKTPFLLACEYLRYEKMYKLLNEESINLNLVDKNGDSCVHLMLNSLGQQKIEYNTNEILELFDELNAKSFDFKKLNLENKSPLDLCGKFKFDSIGLWLKNL